MIQLLKTLLAIVAFVAAPLRAEAGAGHAGIGIGLAGLADWSTELPFIDMMKLSRQWIGHGPDEWEAMSYGALAAAGVFDAQGWPTTIPEGLSSIGTLMLTSLPADAGGAAGRYLVRYDGSGEIRLGGSVANVAGGDGMLEFDFDPAGETVQLDIVATDPEGTGDYIRNISVVRTDRVAAYDSGAVFNPDWLAVIDGFEVLRFMDWSRTNRSTLSAWEDRPEPDDVRYTTAGAPLELMIRLANETGADPWFNIPHLADDAFIRRFAEMVRDGLDPGLTAYVEYSNEVWNNGFSQAVWAEKQAAARWGVDNAGLQFYALRAAEMADIWGEVFGAEAGDRLKRVISTHTSWLGREADILDAPLWVAEEPGRAPPATYFDAYAVTGYFGGYLGNEKWVGQVRQWIDDSAAAAEDAGRAQGLDGPDLAAFVLAHRFDDAVEQAARELSGANGARDGDVGSLVGETLPYHAEVAAAAGLELVAYEGGSHVVAGPGFTDDETLSEFFVHFNYTAEIGALYTRLLDGWKALDTGVFVAFQDVAAPGRWGSWGHLRHLGDDNPRWDALVAARDGE